MEWFITNSPFFVALVIFVIAVFASFKKGAIKTIGGIISALVSSILVILIAFFVREYFASSKLLMVLTVVLLFLLAVAYMLFNTFFKPIKALSNLAIVKVIDKPLGMILAIPETLIIIWGVFCIIMIMNGGAIENWIMNCVENNAFMRFLYDNNFVYNLIEGVGSKIMGHEILAKWIMN